MAKKFKNKDLAAKLGVSSTLVSLVLNNKADQQGIKKDTQEKVLSLARQMGYFDALQERNETSPIEEKPGVLGMIVPAINDPFVVQITPFLQKAFSSIGVGFSVVTKDPDDQRYDRLINTFKKFYSGLILLGNAADENTIRTLRTADYPFVLLEKSVKTQRLNTINTDTNAGATLVVNHLDKLGYKSIIIVTDRKKFREDTTSVQDLIDALKLKSEMNKPVVVELDKPTDDNIDTSYFEKFLRPPHRSDIMIVMNASLVYPVMAMLRKKNLRVPQDIAVISMEEGTGFDLLFSPVTCLRKPLSGMSIKVANMIWSEVKNQGKGKFKRQVNLSPELIIRSSCGTFKNSQN
ncbi:MAG TPA: LacI family DNA-binding transcriptional regulator [Bacteroidales bacterium]|nr:LacI family DNA-binding transcriptional regulator [Bacteroidales bacterium]